jgi:pyrroloquinoline quinone (PQQ) biosynthesis protein C
MATVTRSDTLALSPRIEERLRRGALSARQVEDFQGFLQEVDRELLQHPIVLDNAYTRWFQEGHASDAELRHFVQQFSVFSNQFLVAALERVINAPSLEQARSAKEILLNELGVIYHRDAPRNGGNSAGNADVMEREGDPELVSTEGTVDGGLFRFRAAHFEWLLAVAQCLGLSFDDIGQRKHGSAPTLHFCDELIRLYGSADAQIAEGASFAVENWAAAGFWQELEDGLLKIKEERHPNLRVAFFTWHNRVEAQHAGHTMEELEAVYFHPHFDRARFFQGGHEVLDAIAEFWNGLEADRTKDQGHG